MSLLNIVNKYPIQAYPSLLTRMNYEYLCDSCFSDAHLNYP